MEELGRIVTLDVLENLVPEDFCALLPTVGTVSAVSLSPNARARIATAAFGSLSSSGTMPTAWKPSVSAKTNELPRSKPGQKRREHRAIQDLELVSNVLWRGALFEGGMEHKVVIGHMPGHAQRMTGQDNQPDRPPGQRLDFDGVVPERAEGHHRPAGLPMPTDIP